VSYVTPVPGVTSAQVADEVVAEITKLGGRAIANHSSVTDWPATKEAANPHTTLKPGHRADQGQRLGPPGSAPAACSTVTTRSYPRPRRTTCRGVAGGLVTAPTALGSGDSSSGPDRFMPMTAAVHDAESETSSYESPYSTAGRFQRVVVLAGHPVRQCAVAARRYV